MDPNFCRASSHRLYEALVRKTRSKDRAKEVSWTGSMAMRGGAEQKEGSCPPRYREVYKATRAERPTTRQTWVMMPLMTPEEPMVERWRRKREVLRCLRQSSNV
jgi:hypothetical protein